MRGAEYSENFSPFLLYEDHRWTTIDPRKLAMASSRTEQISCKYYIYKNYLSSIEW